MANFAVELRRTLHNSQSLGTIVADATRPRRGSIYEITFSSEATSADNQLHWRLRRVTTAGTSTSVTPVALNPADAATESDAGENHSAEPTYTANSELLSFGLNQKATYRWTALAPHRQIFWPATASNGVGVDNPSGAAVTIIALAHFEEE